MYLTVLKKKKKGSDDIRRFPRRTCDSHMTVRPAESQTQLSTEQARAQHRAAELLGDCKSCSPWPLHVNMRSFTNWT